jgi:thioredoxin reductase
MNHHESIILGAGPAGLQMGYFMEQAKRDYLILTDNSSVGSFFNHFPRHGTLISINKRFNWYPEPEFNLRHDWNSLITNDYSHQFRDYSQELFPKNTDLVRYLRDFAAKYELRIRYETPIVRIARESNHGNFVLTDREGNTYSCKRLLLATGAIKPLIPPIEGIELAAGYENHELDPEYYANKRVVIIGGGNSAFEIANHLAGHAAIIFIMIGNRLLKHAWNTHFVGDLRAVNDTVLDMFQLKALHAVTGTTMTKISRLPDGSLRVDYEEETPHWNTPGTVKGWFVVDHVIRATGFKYVEPNLFAPDIVPAMDSKEKYPVLSPVWESSVPDMYFIGTAMAARDRKAASGFIHGFRYNVRTLFNYLEARHHDGSMPSDQFAVTNEAEIQQLSEHIIKRISTTSALYQLFGVLCDVLVIEDGKAELFYELPVEYVLTQWECREKRMVIFTLEFGLHQFANKEAVTFIRRNDPERPGCVSFLHPVFRYYEKGEFVKGRNVRSASVLRWDQAAEIFEMDENSRKPQNILLNFLNEFFGLPIQPLAEEHFRNDEEDHMGFTPWLPGDPRLNTYPVQRCILSAGDPEVTAITFPAIRVEVNNDG